MGILGNFRLRARLNRALELERQGRLPQARAAFEEVVRRHPENADGWFHLARVCFDLRDTCRAGECYHEALQRAPGRVDILHAQAESYALKMPAAGLEAGKRAVRTMLEQMNAKTFDLPGFPRELPLVFIRNLALEQRLTGNALAFFKELAQGPVPWIKVSALLHAGLLFANMGQYPDAIARYQEALAEDAHAHEAHFNLAMTAMRRRDFSTARTHMTAFSKIHLKSPVTTWGMAFIAETQGEIAEAERLYRFFRDRYAQDPPPRDFLSRLDLARGWQDRARIILEAADQHRREGHEGHIREATDETTDEHG